MDTRTNQTVNSLLILNIAGNVTSIIALIFNAPLILGLDSKDQIFGRLLLLFVAISTTLFLIYQATRIFLQNSRKIILIGEHVQEYINHIIASNSDEIILIYQSKMLLELDLIITKKKCLSDFPTGTGREALELHMNKGLKHGLIEGINLSVYENHRPEPLFTVRLSNHAPTTFRRPNGRIYTDYTLLTSHLESTWAIDDHNLREHEFFVKVIVPRASTPIADLVSTLLIDLKRNWSIIDIIRSSG